MPFKNGRTIVGWGVVRLSPWDFDRVYQTREEAEAEAAKMGSDYQVLWGENREGTEDFIFGEPPANDERSDDYATYLTADDGNRRVDEEGDDRDTEDGDRRVTEDGDRILVEDDAPPVQSPDLVDQPTIVEAVLSASGVSSANAVGESVWRAPPTPEQAAQLQKRLSSASWTGIEQRIAATPGSIEQVGSLIAQLDLTVEQCGLTNYEQQRAKALTGALMKLVSSPQPEWQLIVNILNSPVLSALWRFKDISILLAGLVYWLVGNS